MLNRFLIGWAVVVIAVVTVAAPASAEEFPGHAPAEYVVLGDSYALT